MTLSNSGQSSGKFPENFNVEWVDQCDSTSRVLKDRARDFFSDSPRVPLAIAAGIQTAGTGRMGRQWASVAGNLHFSIALPEAYVASDIRDILPLAAAVIVSRWLRDIAAVSPCLKWPNDLILDGKKIAGILCEGTFHGSEFTGAVIGIGVNLAHAPSHQDAESYPSGALNVLTGFSMNPRAAADSLAAVFARDWNRLSRAGIFGEWSRVAVGTGHYWLSLKSGASGYPDYVRCNGLTADGFLSLSPIRKLSATGGVPGEDIVLTSVTNDFKWSVQRDARMLVADVGNSRTKLALVSIAAGGGIVVHESVSDKSGFAEILEFAARHISSGVVPLVHALSVNPDGVRALRETLKTRGIDVRDIRKEPVRAVNSDYDLNAIGADRLACIEAAHDLHLRGALPWPAMCVSLGTATTIDILNGSGRHLGGYIAAGLQTSLDAASNKGAMLPKALDVLSAMNSEFSESLWPRGSADAMIRASVESTLALLRSERQKLAQLERVDVNSVKVLLTGGYAELIKKFWDDDQVIHVPGLVLQGAGIMAMNGR